MTERAQLKSLEFRRGREKSWRELEKLVARVERNGVRSLTGVELARLPVLYRATISSLSVARAVSLDKNVVHYLESLASRAYLCVYSNKEGFWPALRRFITVRFPSAVREITWHLVAATIVLALGGVTAHVMVTDDPERFYSFVSAEYAQGRGPTSSTEDLRAILYHTDDRIIDALLVFASYLFTHNANIGLLSFALGIVPWIPVVFLTFYNGLVLGAFSALYSSRDLGVEFWAWVLPHGVTELLALLLCSAAGLALGSALLFPGRHRRIENLALRGKMAGSVALGCVGMFLIAGLIEGIFRQTVTNVTIRAFVALSTAGLWVIYFSRCGRSAER